MNWVSAPAAMLNVFQLMIVLWLDWVIVTVLVPCPAIVAEPLTTWPLSGLAKAPPSGVSASTSASVNSSGWARTRRHRRGARAPSPREELGEGVLGASF